MAQLGQYCKLPVVKIVDFGVYLNDSVFGNVLLPHSSAPKHVRVGDQIDVFLYHDAENRIIATTQKPFGVVGEFAYLKCMATNNVGSFMHWGLPKDLFVPFREQKSELVEGRYYVVRIYEDEETHRLAGTTKFHRFFDSTPDAFEYNMEVNLIILHETDIGVAAIIDHRYPGMLYHSEIFRDLRPGDECKGYIKCIREDGKVDLSLQPQGYQAIDPLSDIVVKYLLDHDDVMDLTDDSSPADIYATFAMSKKQFKKVLGMLLKQDMIALSPGKVTLVRVKK